MALCGALQLALLASMLTGTSPVQAQVETWSTSTWRSDVRYRMSFSAAVAETGQLQVAGVDSCEVFVNGDLVVVSTSPEQLTSATIEIGRGTNHIAVRVANDGAGGGNGMVLQIDADSLGTTGTSTDVSRAAWFWIIGTDAGADWTTRNVSRDPAWTRVQAGSLPAVATGNAGLTAEAVAGLPGSMDAGSAAGVLQLGAITGANLALTALSNRVDVNDGNVLSVWAPPVNALNFHAEIDLLSRRRIHTVRALTAGTNETQLRDNTLRGYSVQVSDDRVGWSEVAIVRDIEDSVRSGVSFDPVTTRYVRVVVIQINAVTQPRVGEIEIYGAGLADSGSYISEPLDFGTAAPKFFGDVRWDADVPAGTTLAVRWRALEAPQQQVHADSFWSVVQHVPGPYPGAEPARYVQYRVDMSGDGARTPQLRRLQVDWSSSGLPAASLRGRIQPRAVPMNVDTTFVYTLDVTMDSASVGVARLDLAVPHQAELLDVAGAVPDTWSSTSQRLRLNFDPPLQQDGPVEITLRTRTNRAIHNFAATAYAALSNQPLNVTVNDDVDADGVAFGSEVRATTSTPDVLTDLGPAPSVLTPNGDGRNDNTVFGFGLTKLSAPQRVTIRLFDLAGRLVATVFDGLLAAGDYGPGSSEAPGLWDGRNDDGQLVAPGVYLYVIDVDVDTGREKAAGSVAVVY